MSLQTTATASHSYSVPDAAAAATATSDAEEAALQLFQWPREHAFCWY